MLKPMILVVFGMVLLPATVPKHANFARYKAVEAYEIRPGILMIPTYSVEGQVCQIGLEELHFSPEKIRLDSNLSREEIDQIFQELVPTSERGPRPKNPVEQVIGGYLSGRAIVSDEEYQNVSIRIYGAVSGKLFDTDKSGATVIEMVATLKWKNRDCL